jgi:hypothetical protein
VISSKISFAGVNSMPENESCGDCDRVFGTRLKYVEEELTQLKKDLRAVSERENQNSESLNTKITVLDSTMKLWVTMGGAIVGIGTFILDKIWK